VLQASITSFRIELALHVAAFIMQSCSEASSAQPSRPPSCAVAATDAAGDQACVSELTASECAWLLACAQVAQFLRAGVRPWAAALSPALCPSPEQALHQESTRPRSHAAAHAASNAAAGMLAQAHADIVEAVVAAHPVLSDHRRPLLCQKLAALPPCTHRSACAHIVRVSGGGVVGLGTCNEQRLLQALAVLSCTTSLSQLSIGPDRLDQWGRCYQDEATQAHPAPLAAARPLIAALTGVTSLHMHGACLDDVSALLLALADLPALAEIALAHLDAGGSTMRGHRGAMRGRGHGRSSITAWHRAGWALQTRLRTFAARLAACSTLVSLSLDGVDDDGGELGCLAPHLATMTGLERLTAWRFSSESAHVVLLHVASLSRLTHLEIAGGDLDSSGMHALARAAPALSALRHLSITHREGWTAQLAGCQGCLSHITGLTCLVAQIAAVVDFVPGSDRIALLAPALPQLHQLLRLKLVQVISDHSGDDDGVSALAGHLAALTQLQHLELPQVETQMYGIAPASPCGARVLQAAFASLTCLTHLDMSRAFEFYLSQFPGQANLPLPPNAPAHAHLDLSDGSIEAAGEASLAEALLAMTVLTYLGLPVVGRQPPNAVLASAAAIPSL
jgi:hypothetical protein